MKPFYLSMKRLQLNSREIQNTYISLRLFFVVFILIEIKQSVLTATFVSHANIIIIITIESELYL